MCTLVHELVHFSQYQEGRLKMVGNDTFWLGENWSERFYDAQVESFTKGNREAYLNLPWEIEAREKEEELRRKLNV